MIEEKLDKKFINIVNEIKNEIKTTQIKVTISVRNLKYMKKFYLEYKDDELVQRVVAQLPWGHNIVLMSKIKDKLYQVETKNNKVVKDNLDEFIEMYLFLNIMF